MKTAVTVLQEMMIKLGQTPQYEFLSQSGPQHQSMFDYRCLACGVVTKASARSKKEAKQEVARIMLQQLSLRGYDVPSPFGLMCDTSTLMEESLLTPASSADTRSYVALLKELCEEYRLAAVEYELVGDTGPPHLRYFTVKARIGQHERFATATTKKTARQLAAEKLYSYLRENLARVTRDFDEDEALVRARQKAMERYHEDQELPRRPDLGQKISAYHTSLTVGLDEETRSRVRAQLENQSPTRALTNAAAALRLELGAEMLGPVAVVTLSGGAPDLAFAGLSSDDATAAAIRYLRLALR